MKHGVTHRGTPHIKPKREEKKKMPKLGYTAITVSLSLKHRLKETVKALGYGSVPALINDLLNRYQYQKQRRALTTPTNGLHRKPQNNFLQQKQGKITGNCKCLLVRSPGFEPG